MTATSSLSKKNPRTLFNAEPDASTGLPVGIAGTESSPLIGMVDPIGSDCRRSGRRLTEARKSRYHPTNSFALIPKPDLSQPEVGLASAAFPSVLHPTVADMEGGKRRKRGRKLKKSKSLA
jgi:hypothetical protein